MALLAQQDVGKENGQNKLPKLVSLLASLGERQAWGAYFARSLSPRTAANQKRHPPSVCRL